MQLLFYYKMRQIFIANCDSYYKMRHLIEIVTSITKFVSTLVLYRLNFEIIVRGIPFDFFT